MSQAKLKTADGPFLLVCDYEAKNATAKEKALNCLKTSADHQLKHHPGVITYHFGEVEDNPLSMRFVELYLDSKVFFDHSKEPLIEKALSLLFDAETIRANASTRVISESSLEEGVNVVINHLQAKNPSLLGGCLVNPLWEGSGDHLSPFLVHCEFTTPSETSAKILSTELATLADSVRKDEKIGRSFSTFVVIGGKSKLGVEMLVIGSEAERFFGLMEEKTKLFKDNCDPTNRGKISCVLWGNLTSEAIEKGNTLEWKVKQLKTVGGYVLHPGASHQIERKKVPPPPPLSSPVAVPENLFSVNRNKYTGIAESVVFRNNAQGRSPHLSKTEKVPTYDKTRNLLSIPLLHVIRSLCSRGHLDLEIPMTLLYSQLERLRSLRDDSLFWNQVIDDTEQEKGSDISQQLKKYQTKNQNTEVRVSRFLANLSNFGYPLPQPNSKVVIDQIDSLVEVIESENAELIRNARQSIEEGRVLYMGLQELYKIGSHVTWVSGLSGTNVGLRVVDVRYQPLNSLFGIELFVHLGDSYLLLPYEECIDDWEGAQDITELKYRPMKDSEFSIFQERGAKVAALGLEPSHRSYAATAFFPRNLNVKGVSPSALTSSGRIMIDVQKGIELGLSPCPTYDTCGTAMQTSLKQFRILQREQKESESAEQKAERHKANGFTILRHLPVDSQAIVWPGVIGFSFQAKTWGVVLVDGLQPVKFDSDAFDTLALAPEKKEILLALVKDSFHITSGDSNPNEERFCDILSSRGSGSLFLLHGPPGTGKTLTAEALANVLHLPFYSISFGEIGSTPAELENRFGELLSLCARWKALVLLDEGDALLERRKTSQVVLNSMTGLLLHFLDSFNGCLFITSNRVNVFDEAVLSRVTLAIRYQPLGPADREMLWKNVLKRAGCQVDNFDYSELGKWEISGREINAAVRLALSLSRHRRETRLTHSTLTHSLQIATAFRQEFKEPSSEKIVEQ